MYSTVSSGWVVFPVGVGAVAGAVVGVSVWFLTKDPMLTFWLSAGSFIGISTLYFMKLYRYLKSK